MPAQPVHRGLPVGGVIESDLPIRLVLVAPTPGVDFGIQRGGGSHYETLFVQQVKHGDIIFDFSLRVTENRKDSLPNFKGSFVQGSPANRFIYVDVGTYAGQKDTQWSRRMKVPLQGITWALIRQATNKPGCKLLGRIAGKGKDGGPNCATVELLGHWEVI
jgi:hypothetical protein